MDLERLEKIDKLKTKMLKYIFYKRRTEKEIIEKFKDEESDIFEEAVETLKELGYIDDSDYVSRYIHDVMIFCVEITYGRCLIPDLSGSRRLASRTGNKNRE